MPAGRQALYKGHKENFLCDHSAIMVHIVVEKNPNFARKMIFQN